MTATMHLLVVVALFAIFAPGMAQDCPTVTGTSNYGSITLTAGTFGTRIVELSSGGSISASCLGRSRCLGYTTRRPDLRIFYSAGSLNHKLRIFFVGPRGDATLLVNDANGCWVCNDDSIYTTCPTLNPQVDLLYPNSGAYDIWVGSRWGNEFVRGYLWITEDENFDWNVCNVPIILPSSMSASLITPSP